MPDSLPVTSIGKSEDRPMLVQVETTPDLDRQAQWVSGFFVGVFFKKNGLFYLIVRKYIEYDRLIWYLI
mgnify:CR=1 FL=1